ncbi:leucyl/phenylalanyl-tRNA--protein transferase [Polymorphobacter fuscus]|uniref:Leucyl/phenylalanyl-tRNA--protein transferase n=1 Tax=Sandarakinorhabdus fusca TaxID=1439888 RepID=A0A7C9GNB7_9SPHN|nr:leucyl/phenylalanyl-tRNA--protein transferase [Polymorphobacter fuscus]KAB7649130.1 leucyl/phenylalanyl-tRNA--protein transferase [Polymorphobacter fuscus]MQT16615.1 leucyl/phenylalanyl-tRNA--protein transferase [Polymorphobacter fuscus]
MLKTRLAPETLLRAYASGIFPMADSATAKDVFWVEPKRRGVLPLDGFHLSKSLAKTLKSERFTLTADRAFDEVLDGCAEPVPDRTDTWINPLIAEAYRTLHTSGHAHSIEAWTADGALAGGLYGVRLGGAFFGESMFTRVRDASKCALAALVARLRVGGFTLLDTQFLTDHLATFGAREITARTYRGQLGSALGVTADFFAFDGFAASPLAAPPTLPAVTVSGPVSGNRIVQLLTQMS